MDLSRGEGCRLAGAQRLQIAGFQPLDRLRAQPRPLRYRRLIIQIYHRRRRRRCCCLLLLDYPVRLLRQRRGQQHLQIQYFVGSRRYPIQFPLL